MPWFFRLPAIVHERQVVEQRALGDLDFQSRRGKRFDGGLDDLLYEPPSRSWSSEMLTDNVSAASQSRAAVNACH